MIDRIINVLIILSAITFIVGMGIGYGYFPDVFSAGTFWKFSVACLFFAITLTLLMIKNKK
ncbi:MAG: hypothetical protein NG712_01610 [Omnitrophica bacterium]|nr:hypothetical protein [Candidatus Omnitrophota bacterium]